VSILPGSGMGLDILYHTFPGTEACMQGKASGMMILTCCSAGELWTWWAIAYLLGDSGLNNDARALYPWTKMRVAGNVGEGVGGSKINGCSLRTCLS